MSSRNNFPKREYDVLHNFLQKLHTYLKNFIKCADK